MVTISDFASQHRFQTQLDKGDGTTIIPGRKGASHLFEYGEGLLGVPVMPNAGTAHWWNAARESFRRGGMEIRQDCDGEGVATFDPDNSEHVRLALKYAGITRKRNVSGATLNRLREIGFRKSLTEVVPRLQSEIDSTVGAEKTI
jgi:hypothetical protein